MMTPFCHFLVSFTALNNNISLESVLARNLNFDGARQTVEVSCSFATFGGS